MPPKPSNTDLKKNLSRKQKFSQLLFDRRTHQRIHFAKEIFYKDADNNLFALKTQTSKASNAINAGFLARGIVNVTDVVDNGKTAIEKLTRKTVNADHLPKDSAIGHYQKNDCYEHEWAFLGLTSIVELDAIGELQGNGTQYERELIKIIKDFCKPQRQDIFAISFSIVGLIFLVALMTIYLFNCSTICSGIHNFFARNRNSERAQPVISNVPAVRDGDVRSPDESKRVEEDSGNQLIGENVPLLQPS